MTDEQKTMRHIATTSALTAIALMLLMVGCQIHLSDNQLKASKAGVDSCHASNIGNGQFLGQFPCQEKKK